MMWPRACVSSVHTKEFHVEIVGENACIGLHRRYNR